MPTYRTLGELRAELMARLGMGAMGANGASQVLMASFLRNGQHQLYQAQDWKHLTWYEDKTVGVGQSAIDYPAACARDTRVLRVELQDGGRWCQLREGIDTEHWSTMDTPGTPARFERLAQIVLWPKAVQIYTVRVWYVADLGRFTQDADRATLDDQMVLLHALATGKAHYRHPDAAMYEGQLAQLLASLRGRSFGVGADGVVRRRAERDDDPLAGRRPLVVGRDV